MPSHVRCLREVSLDLLPRTMPLTHTTYHLHQQASSFQPRSINLSIYGQPPLSCYNGLPLLNATNHPGCGPIVLNPVSFIDWPFNELLQLILPQESLPGLLL